MFIVNRGSGKTRATTSIASLRFREIQAQLQKLHLVVKWICIFKSRLA